MIFFKIHKFIKSQEKYIKTIVLIIKSSEIVKIDNIFCVNEQAEDQLDYEMDNMEILPHN